MQVLSQNLTRSLQNLKNNFKCQIKSNQARCRKSCRGNSKRINSAEQFDEVGTVLTVSDGVARIYGLRNAEANELLEFENGTRGLVMNLEEDNVGCILFGATSGIKEGMEGKAYPSYRFYPC